MTSRLPKFAPTDLNDAQRELYDTIAGGPRAAGPQLFALTDSAGCLNGPFNAMLLAPALGHALQNLGAAIRYRTSLSGRVREMAILLVAARWDSAFERYAHEPIGAAAGLTSDELAALRAGKAPELPDASERVAVELVRALLDGDVDDATYAAAVTTIGDQAVFEMTTLVGYYATLALQLRVFRVDAPKVVRVAPDNVSSP
jgi:4-carboxymuconolactone decarboxylase